VVGFRGSNIKMQILTVQQKQNRSQNWHVISFNLEFEITTYSVRSERYDHVDVI